jgi:hypothetical protein
METRRRVRLSSVRALVGLSAMAGLLAACTVAASLGPSAPTSTRAVATATPAPSAPSVVTVAWGRIWDQVPSSFPLLPDAEPAQPADPVAGPSSGTFTTGLGVDEATQRIQAALRGAGWSLGAMTSAEDGSHEIPAVGANPGCRSLVTVRALGSMHFVTVYYGAGCPRP